ncbi:MAG: hypothetical protein KTR31_15790 [Myxococcales bacterium]|nr:hypothetical protein [Myxococcales bacterium]
MRLVGRAWAAGVVAGWLSACGTSEPTFVTDYADLYCERALACADAAELLFDGVDSVDACLAIVGPDTADRADRCRLRGSDARACLAELESVECPAEGEGFDTVVPVACADAWHTCTEQGAVEDT